MDSNAKKTKRQKTTPTTTTDGKNHVDGSTIASTLDTKTTTIENDLQQKTLEKTPPIEDSSVLSIPISLESNIPFVATMAKDSQQPTALPDHQDADCQQTSPNDKQDGHSNDAPLKIFLCRNHDNRFPEKAWSLTIAKDERRALELHDEALRRVGLSDSKEHPYTLQEIPLMHPLVLLCGQSLPKVIEHYSK